MKRFGSAVLAAVLVAGSGSLARAADQAAQDIVDKAIKALGGEQKLAGAKAVSWQAKSKITFNENENTFNTKTTIAGIDRARSEIEGEFNGNAFMGVTVLNGNKAWRRFGDMETMELDGDQLANQKRNIYLQAVPVLLTPLKSDGFKVESAGDGTAGGKPAAVVKVTPPDGKDFKLYFDKESGLPVMQVAKVVGFQGEEYTQETTFADYKDFDGIKKATKVESKRDGERFMQQEISNFKVLSSVDASTFSEPK